MSLQERDLLAGVKAILGADGLLANSGVGQFNPQQYEYAVQVAKGFCRYRESDRAAGVNLQQASTGTGKTLGYLVPAMLHAALTGSRVAVSTYTRHLQHQILSKDAVLARQWVADYTGTTLQVSRRVGRQNYLSRSACQGLLATLEEAHSPVGSPTARALAFMGQLCAWLDAADAPAPILDDFVYASDDGTLVLPEGISRKQLCIDSNSPAEEIEAYQQDVERTRQADVVITNHAMTMLNAYRFASILDGDRPMDLLICDEADRLADAAESVLSADLSLNRMKQLSLQVGERLDQPQVPAAIAALYDAVKSIRDEGHTMVLMPAEVLAQAHKTLAVVEGPAAAFAATLREPHGHLSTSQVDLMADFVDSVADLQRICATASDRSNTCLISWSPVRQYPSLRIGNPNPARVINRLIAPRDWDEPDTADEAPALLPPRSYLKACLFTSATLSTPGKALPAAFDAFAAQVGIIRHCAKGSDVPVHNTCVDLYRCFEPRLFGQMSFVLADPQVDSPTQRITDDQALATVSSSPEWLDYCASMIRAAAAMPGRTLVLALSFRDTRALAKRLQDMPNLIVHRQGEMLSSFEAQYKDSANPQAVLITPTGWEGLDLPGMVNNLVITRIPASPPDSFRATLNNLCLKQRGYSPDKIASILYAQSVDATRRRLAQGLGRGIRQATDITRVWIADPRFPVPDTFQASLDPLLLQPRRHTPRSELLACIPRRFTGSFRQARLFLASGQLYSPEEF